VAERLLIRDRQRIERLGFPDGLDYPFVKYKHFIDG